MSKCQQAIVKGLIAFASFKSIDLLPPALAGEGER
jgi:hypothetical protein